MTMEQGNETKVAVLEEQIKNLVTAVTGLSNDLKSWRQDYVPRQELDERFKHVYQDLQEMRDDLKETANRSDIDDIKTTLKELKEDKRSSRGLWVAWAGVVVSALAVGVAIITLSTK
jgi:archaellum component FlaC